MMKYFVYCRVDTRMIIVAVITVATQVYMCPSLSGSAKFEVCPGGGRSTGSSPSIDKDKISDVDDISVATTSIQCRTTASVRYELQ